MCDQKRNNNFLRNVATAEAQKPLMKLGGRGENSYLNFLFTGKKSSSNRFSECEVSVIVIKPFLSLPCLV